MSKYNRCSCGRGIADHTRFNRKLETWVPCCKECFAEDPAGKVANFVASALTETFNERDQLRAYSLTISDGTFLIAAASVRQADSIIRQVISFSHDDGYVVRAPKYDHEARVQPAPRIVRELYNHPGGRE